MQVLVVDDSLVVRTIIRQQLTSLNSSLKIEDAKSSKEAWDKIINEKFIPDFCLLDVHMPEESGIDFAKRMRKFPALTSCLILFISSDAHRDTVMQVKALGPVGYLIKPYTPEKLGSYLALSEELRRRNEKASKKVIILPSEKITTDLNVNVVQYVKLVNVLLEKLESMHNKLQNLTNESNLVATKDILNTEMRYLLVECTALGLTEYVALGQLIMDEETWEKDSTSLLNMLGISALRVKQACKDLLAANGCWIAN
ncbi:MAG: hypothetical protein A2007_04810 [Verrucomicrobia bacterium GWC2_42_7]|nr:MAG: hypothetical protein A2007_04810 [Verrucomicrobia bacterium GWC2_42_7]